MKRRLGVCLLALLLGACRAEVGTDLSSEPKEYMEGWTKDDYANAYRKALDRAKMGQPDWQFQVSIMGNPEYGNLPPPQACTKLFEDSLYWLRMAVAAGWPMAIKTISENYAQGTSGFEKDPELSECFRRAQTDKSVLSKCVEAENEKKHPGLQWKQRPNSSRWACN